MTIRFSKLLAVLATSLLALSLATAAWANDRVTLTDGTVVEGTITQELDGYIWMRVRRGAIVEEVIYRASQIDKIERNVTAEKAPEEDARTRPQTRSDQPRSTNGLGTPRAAVISLGGETPNKQMVGIYMTAESIRNVIPLLEEDGVEILVLRVNSDGGYTDEVQRLSDLIEYELKPRFRVVVWVEKAISAAAMTSHAVEEIYFMSTGTYGAATEFSGPGRASTGMRLEQILHIMERISDRGWRDRAIMRSMQIDAPLSASFDEHGRVTWYQDLSGDHIINPGGRVLTLNSQNAERFRFSLGTVDTLDELAKAMGLNEVIWVGDWERGRDYPVSRAERDLIRFRDRTHQDETRFNEYWDGFASAVEVAQNMPREDRGPFINRARRSLERMGGMVRNNSNFARFRFGSEERFWDWYREQEEMLRRLM